MTNSTNKYQWKKKKEKDIYEEGLIELAPWP